MITQTFTLEQAAGAIGITPERLEYWRSDGRLKPAWIIEHVTDTEEAKPDPSAPFDLEMIFRAVLQLELVKLSLPLTAAVQIVAELGGGANWAERNAEQLIAGAKQSYLFVEFSKDLNCLGEVHLLSNPDLDVGLFVDYLAARPSERQNLDPEPASTVVVFCVGAALRRALRELQLIRGK